MNKQFRHAMFGICGATFLSLPLAAQAADRINQMRYYWCNPAKLAQQIQRTGAYFTVLDPITGIQTSFTDMNATGKKPTWSSKLACMGYGNALPVTYNIVDRVTFHEHQNQKGKKPPMVVIEAVSSTENAPTKIVYTAFVAERPCAVDSDQQINLDKKNLG